MPNMRATVTGAGSSIRRLTVGAIAAISMINLSACSDSAQSPKPYSAAIAKALDSTRSDYVRSILEDGQITAAEMRDAQQQNLSCLSESGITAQYVDSGAGYSTLETAGDLDATELKAMVTCADKWTGEAESLYIDQVMNPENKDLNALIAACLVKKELAPEGFDGADFRELMRAHSQSSAQDSPGQDGSVSVEETGDIILPGGQSMSNPQAIMCQMNPSK